MEKKTILIKEIVGSANWIQIADGIKVYEQIQAVLKAGDSVELSFEGRAFVITAFLNAAIGKLYSGQFSEADLDRLTYVSTEPTDDEKIRRVIANAKLYYKNNPDLRDQLFKREVEA